MKAQSVIIGGLLFVAGVAVGMYGRHMAHEMHGMCGMHHHHGPHMGPGHFHGPHDQPFEDIGDLPYVREAHTNGQGLRDES